MGIEAIDIMRLNMTKEEFRGFLIGNVIKYSHRNKGQELKDMQKIQVYSRWLELELDECQIDEQRALADLIRKLKDSGKSYKRIISKGRGGMYVAAQVAYALNITEVWVMPSNGLLDVSFVDALYVDDCADSGDTIKSVKCDTAVLWTRYNCPVEPTYSGLVVDSDAYINVTFQNMEKKDA